MYIEEVENESCETIQRRKVVVVTSERYFSFKEPVYVSNHGYFKEPYVHYDIININGKNKYVANLIKPFKDFDDIHIVYREISSNKREYFIKPLQEIIGDYYVLYDSLNTDYYNALKIPNHSNEKALYDKLINCKECSFELTYIKSDYHKEKVIVGAKDLFNLIKKQEETVIFKGSVSRISELPINDVEIGDAYTYDDELYVYNGFRFVNKGKVDFTNVKGEQGIAGDPKGPSSKETNEVEESDKKQEKSDSSTLLQSLTLMKIEPIRSTGCFIDNALKFIDNRFFLYMTKDGNSISNVKNIDEITGLLIIYNYDDVDKLYWDFHLSILCGDTYNYDVSENSYKIQTLDYELTGSITKVSIDDKFVSALFKITGYKPVQKGDK